MFGALDRSLTNAMVCARDLDARRHAWRPVVASDIFAKLGDIKGCAPPTRGVERT
jgi:hypothetical protein